MARDELLQPGLTPEDIETERLAAAGAAAAGELEELADPVASLRPRSLEEFVGQTELKRRLRVILEAARRRGQPPDHFLFAGPPGLSAGNTHACRRAPCRRADWLAAGDRSAALPADGTDSYARRSRRPVVRARHFPG